MRVISKAVGVTSRRRDRRLREVPLHVEMDGAVYDTVDWSLGGLRISGYAGERQVEEEVPVDVWGELRGNRLGGAATLVIVRRDDATGEIAARFKTFEGDTWDQLEQLSLRRLRPLMVGLP